MKQFYPHYSVTRSTRSILAISAASLLLVSLSAHAAVTFTGTEITGVDENDQSAAFAVASDDLLQTSLATVTFSGSFTEESSAGVPALTDGVFGSAGPKPSASATGNSGDSVTFTLDTTVNTLGYNLSSISTFAGWNTARGQQRYTVAFSTVASPNEFVTLFSDVNYGNLSFSDRTYATRVTLTEDSGTLASGVKALRFSFGDPSFLAYQGYREIDVVGSVVPVPEPATAFTMVGLTGILGMLRRRRA